MTDTTERDAGIKVRVHPARKTVLALGAAAAVVGVALGLYGMAADGGKPASAEAGACAKSLDIAKAIGPLVHGEVAALMPAKAPADLSAIAFDGADGKKTSVGAFKGKTVLLNLWATWCVPCRAEMPALDKLQEALGSGTFQVVAVDVDTVRLDKPPAFLKDIGATHLTFYSDKSADILQALKQTQPFEGLPTTVLIGQDGCAIGLMAGPAVWDSPDAQALIKKANS